MTPGDPWTQQLEAFGRFFTGQRKLAKRPLRELAVRTARQRTIEAEAADTAGDRRGRTDVVAERVVAAAAHVIDQHS